VFSSRSLEELYHSLLLFVIDFWFFHLTYKLSIHFFSFFGDSEYGKKCQPDAFRDDNRFEMQKGFCGKLKS